MPFVRCKLCDEEIWLEDFDAVLDDDKPTKLECSNGHKYDYFKQDRQDTVSKKIKSSYHVLNLVSKSVKSSYKVLHTTTKRHPIPTAISIIGIGFSIVISFIDSMLPISMPLAMTVSLFTAAVPWILLDHYNKHT